MYVRDFLPGDEPALHAVFHSAIHLLAVKDYTTEQLEAWAPSEPIDLENWVAHMRGIRPFVAEDESGIVGYADLREDGCIDHFFVSGGKARRGVGRLLMKRIHERATELSLE